MPADQWLVTVADGLMPATSVTWMFKRLPLQDWLVFSEKFGVPGIWGKTDSTPGTNGWTRMEEAVAAFTSDMAIVTSKGEEITTIERKGGGEIPFPSMVERAERNIMALWRGGDLGTMSSTGAVGSNPQQDETGLLEQDDRELLSETLNMQVEPIVLRWHFGTNVKPLAYIRFSGLNQRNTALDIQVDQMLASMGFPLSQQSAGERYNRTVAEQGEASLRLPSGLPAQIQAPLANAAGSLKQAARESVLNAIASDLQPIRTRLKAILAIEDGDVMKQKLEQLRSDLGKLKRSIGADPAMARALEEIMGAEMVNAMEAAK
jgi:phage gp29-like protein